MFKTLKKIIFLAFSSLFIVACSSGEPTFDGTSKESMEKSFSSMYPDAPKAPYNSSNMDQMPEAMKALLAYKFAASFGKVKGVNPNNNEEVEKHVLQTFQGMTAGEMVKFVQDFDKQNNP